MTKKIQGFLFGFLIFLSSSIWAISPKEIEKSLNAIQTLQATFTQLNHDGSQAAGVFYLQRPDNLKFEYSAPQGSSILAKNGWLRFYDKDQEEESSIEIEQTPAKFLLSKQISLSAHQIKIESIDVSSDRVLVKISDLEQTTTITLLFDKSPLLLKGWHVKDMQNNRTTLEFSDRVFNQPIDQTVFRRTHKIQKKMRN